MVTDYIKTKYAWSETTKRTAASKLQVLTSYDWSDPAAVCADLERQYSPYTVKQYMFLASDYYGGNVADWWQKNAYKFRHAYKEKTRKILGEDFESILESAKKSDKFLYNFLVLCGKAGLRRAEALNARWEDIEDRAGYTVLRVKGKGDKTRLVPIKKDWLVNEASSPKLTGHIAGRYAKLSSAMVNHCFKRVLPGFTPHDLRAMYVTSLSQKLQLKEVATLAGHSSVQTTERYVRTDLDHIVRKMAF